MDNKVAIVTGASQGIGASVAIRLARQKYSVVIVYKSSDHKANSVLQKCNKFTKSIVIKADVTKKNEW